MTLPFLYVIYSDKAPTLPEGTALIPTLSPKQNYSELWVQKKIWERGLPPQDWIGFFHQRRYLDFSVPISPVVSLPRRQLPYRIKTFPQFSLYTVQALSPKLEQYDLIAPFTENSGISVFKRYGTFKHQRLRDLELAVTILKNLYPDYSDAAETYLSGTCEFYGNLYVMRGEPLNQYLSWLFPILSAFEKETLDALSRTPGYLAERLFGIWITKCLAQQRWRCGFLPRVHFSGYDDATHHFRRDAYINLILPPASRRRLFVKKLLRRG